MKTRYGLIALTLVLATCGGSASGAEASDLPDPCALVPQSAVDGFFPNGAPIAESGDVYGPGGTSGGNSCSWTSGFDVLDVSVFVKSSFLTPRSICDYCEDVADLGDDAWGGRTDQGAGGTLLAVVVGDVGVQVRADGLDSTVDDLIPLAGPVVQALP